MLSLGQFQAYREIKETEDATFVHPRGQEDQSRKIKMRILAEKPVNIYIVPVEYDYDTGEVIEHKNESADTRVFHLEPGLETVEFYWLGSFCVRPLGCNIWMDTFDNTKFNVESVDPLSFAVLIEREARDPRILEMERQARSRMIEFQEQMAAQVEDALSRAAALEERLRNVAAASSASSSSTASVQPQGTGVSSASDQQAAGPAQSGNGGEPQTNA